MSKRCKWKVRESAACSSLVVHEGKRGREWSGMGKGLWGMCPEHLHGKRERIGNNAMCGWKVLCRDIKFVLSSYKKEATEERHEMRAVGGSRH